MTTRVLSSIADAVAASDSVAVAPLAWNPVDHLLSRFAFGPTDAARAEVTQLGIQSWFNKQVTIGRANQGYGAVPQVAAQGPLLALSPYDCRQALADTGAEFSWEAMDQLTEVTLGLQVWSPAQFYETLVDFFSNHLNVPNHNGDVWITRHAYDRDVIRKYALGRFSDMLVASSKHPAMLAYLSLGASTKKAINENYGRELLELHTVGLRYSEPDVRNTATMLTGRTVDDNYHYLFDDYIHPTGPVKVLGFTDANSDATKGEAAGDRLLRYLAAHPYTAQNLARKLCVRFVSDNPSQTLVDAVAQAYVNNATAIVPTVRTILRSTEFWESRGQKVRRPAENVVATMRQLNPTVTDWSQVLQPLHWTTSSMGNCPLDWPAPNGYPDVAAAWRSAGSLLAMWNTHLGVAGSWWGGFKTGSADSFYGTAAPATSADAVKVLTKRLTGVDWNSTHLGALQQFLGESASTPLGKSTLRWLGTPLLALILDAPHFALR